MNSRGTTSWLSGFKCTAVTWGTFTSSSCHWCCRWQMTTKWRNAPSTDIRLDSQPESCSWDREGSGGTLDQPCPRGQCLRVSAVFCAEVSSTHVNQNYARTSTNQDGERYSTQHSLCYYWAPCSLKMPRFETWLTHGQLTPFFFDPREIMAQP